MINPSQTNSLTTHIKSEQTKYIQNQIKNKSSQIDSNIKIKSGHNQTHKTRTQTQNTTLTSDQFKSKQAKTNQIKANQTAHKTHRSN